MVHGNDRTAIGRNAYGTGVFKSTDDGEKWTVRYPACLIISYPALPDIIPGAARYHTRPCLTPCPA